MRRQLPRRTNEFPSAEELVGQIMKGGNYAASLFGGGSDLWLPESAIYGFGDTFLLTDKAHNPIPEPPMEGGKDSSYSPYKLGHEKMRELSMLATLNLEEAAAKSGVLLVENYGKWGRYVSSFTGNISVPVKGLDSYAVSAFLFRGNAEQWGLWLGEKGIKNVCFRFEFNLNIPERPVANRMFLRHGNGRVSDYL